MTYNLDSFVARVEEIVEKHRADDAGNYYQKLESDTEKTPSMYGCATAVSILYTVGKLPQNEDEIKKLVNILQGHQSENTGLFINEGNYSTHTTAFMAGALDLLDSKCLYEAYDFGRYNAKVELHNFLDSLDWEDNPWLAAHLGSGIYASMILTGTAIDEWQSWYFEWFDNNIDKTMGIWKKGINRNAPLFHYLAAAFHYVFNYEYANRKVPCAKEMLKTCIDAYEAGMFEAEFKDFGWAYMDYTYLLVRLQKYTDCFHEKANEIIEELARKLIDLIQKSENVHNERLDNLNILFATVSALAVMQEALPEIIKSTTPLQLVLNKRPFL